MKSISTTEYNNFLTAIKAANDSEDKKALAQIKKRLMTEFEQNNDTYYLLRQFRYDV